MKPKMELIEEIIGDELSSEEFIGWMRGRKLFDAIIKYHNMIFEKDDAGHVDLSSISEYRIGRSLSPGVMCASEVQILRDQERINAMSGKLKNKWACETDPGDYAPTEEYVRDDKKWVDQEYIKSLIEKEQTADKAAHELAKTLDQKYKNGDWENGE